MTDSGQIQIDLGRFLSKRLYPLSLGIGLLIALCFPAAYYILEYKGFERTAVHYAQKTADKFQDVVITAPTLWKYQIYTFTEIKRELFQDSDVLSVRLYDAKNLPIPNYSYNLSPDETSAWWKKSSPKGTANIYFNNEKIGRVEIVVSQKDLLIETAFLFLICTVVGLLLAYLSYNFPVRVVQKLEAELQKLFSDIHDAYQESDLLKLEAQSSEKRFRDLVDGLDAVVWEADTDNRRYSFVSQQAENLFLFPINQWQTSADFFNAQIFIDDRERVLKAYLMSAEQGSGCELEYRRISRDGSIIWVRDNLRLVTVNAKEKQLRGVLVDITNKRHAEEALNEANLELNQSVRQLEQRNLEITALHEMSDMFQLCREREEAYRIIEVVAEKLFPEDSGAFYILDSSRNMLELACSLGNGVKHEQNFPPDSCWALRRGNTNWSMNNKLVCTNKICEIDNQCFCIPMLSQGDTIGVFHLELTSGNKPGRDRVAEDTVIDYEAKYQLAVSMTEHIAMALANLSLRETLRFLSIRDPLTSLFNRRHMEETLMREIVLAERTSRTLGIIMMDIDHFKSFNDTYGHDAGDTLLKEFGRFLLNNIREYDIACRYGGEEFICILPETTLEKALERAEELRISLMSFRVEHLGRPLGMVTISAGVAIYPLHGTTEATIVKSADEALYRAKENGRNRVVAASHKGIMETKEEPFLTNLFSS
ncbi:MAG: diguanylate cyclase [Geobacter sp.]|nr:diguanylate cyclase [Geobacter sp.]